MGKEDKENIRDGTRGNKGHANSKEIEGVLNALLPLRGKAASKYQAYKDREINKHFKVVLNEDHMKQYLQAGRVTQETLDKIRSVEFKEVIKYA